jgi:hypothetical protein
MNRAASYRLMLLLQERLQMKQDTLVAVFGDHRLAELAIRKTADSPFNMKHVQYETDLKADKCLVTAHGSADTPAHARTILASAGPSGPGLYHDALPATTTAVAA